MSQTNSTLAVSLTSSKKKKKLNLARHDFFENDLGWIEMGRCSKQDI
jgi:hypothetical protein